MVEFIVRDVLKPWPSPPSYPAVYLINDNWDDFGFKTLFVAHLKESSDASPYEVGYLKVMVKGSESGRTPMPTGWFEQLPDIYCSLGLDFTYYETLQRSGESLRDEVLEALRDVARFPEIEKEFRDEEAFKVSLVRQTSASRALVDSRAMFEDASTATEMSFRFRTSVGGSTFELDLDFGDTEDLPSRVCAIIGYNGVGKTRLLANLATVAQTSLLDRGAAEVAEQFGKFVGTDPEFSVVVTVSYSAFDTFPIPTGIGGHKYCGLRRVLQNATLANDWSEAKSLQDPQSDSSKVQRQLKSTDDLAAEFLDALELAKRRDRLQIFEAAMKPLSIEPSFAEVEVLELLKLSRSGATTLFGRLSTGHKIVLNIVTQLLANLQPNALVVIDEPESHLHPPLLAALFRSISTALDGFNSFGVIATHSPVVLQEIPRRYVRILQRVGSLTSIIRPEIETFGENVGLLTRIVFDLDNSGADFQSILRRLHRSMSFEEIELLFDGELSSQAAALLMSLPQSEPQ